MSWSQKDTVPPTGGIPEAAVRDSGQSRGQGCGGGGGDSVLGGHRRKVLEMEGGGGSVK